MSEAEQWARMVIFILVGGYAFVVFILTLRFVIRNCFLQRPAESNRWEQFLSENSARAQRGEAPPQFDEAITMKVPISFIEIEEPPSYEEYVRKYSTISSDSINKTLPLLLKNKNSLPERENNPSGNYSNTQTRAATYQRPKEVGQCNLIQNAEIAYSNPTDTVITCETSEKSISENMEKGQPPKDGV